MNMFDESYTYWSAGELHKLQELVASGYNTTDIAKLLGRSHNAIKLRLYHLKTARLAASSNPRETMITIDKD